uniref:G-protein coupled receptors family 2 profile 2 domain-containing protein n=1 Tax=Neogobius melanostomus TaxID=47308 RepID=A0A8C6WG01_9GOBI
KVPNTKSRLFNNTGTWSFVLVVIVGIVHRNCTAEGWSDLLVPYCCILSHLYFSYVKTMYTVGYTLSLISLTIAITIFCLFRKLHCTRNHIHVQLFLSFILRAIFIFVRDSMLFANEDLYHCDYYPVISTEDSTYF